jgi:hypothetical protein
MSIIDINTFQYLIGIRPIETFEHTKSLFIIIPNYWIDINVVSLDPHKSYISIKYSNQIDKSIFRAKWRSANNYVLQSDLCINLSLIDYKNISIGAKRFTLDESISIEARTILDNLFDF